MDGAQALIKTLDELGIEYIFGYSGGAALPIFDALETVKSNIKFILTRHEQGATHMADGYARATGKPAVVLVTSGPGAGNTITGIMTAQMDSVPMIIITGQQVTWMLGKDAFQEADTFGLTLPIVKHNYLVRKTNDLPRIAREAYHIATTGRPGPVLIDVPKDISQSPFTGVLDEPMDLPGYRPEAAFEIDHEAVLIHSRSPIHSRDADLARAPRRCPCPAASSRTWDTAANHSSGAKRSPTSTSPAVSCAGTTEPYCPMSTCTRTLRATSGPGPGPPGCGPDARASSPGRPPQRSTPGARWTTTPPSS